MTEFLSLYSDSYILCIYIVFINSLNAEIEVYCIKKLIIIYNIFAELSFNIILYFILLFLFFLLNELMFITAIYLTK